MKRILFFLLIALTGQLVNAQSVGIGTTTPNTSAQLDVTSTTKGMLIPRMTGAQRTAIPSPEPGLLVIQTNSEVVPPSTPGLYLFEQSGIGPGAWKRIARADEITGGTSTWTVNGSNQYSNVAGNVGIGTSSPSTSALLDVTSTSKGILVPRMTTTQRTAIVSPAPGLFVYDITSNGFWYYNGSTWVQISSGGSSNWLNNANDIYNANSGNVGIGTSSPSASALLDVSSTSKGILVPRMTSAQRTAIVSPAAGLLVYDNSLKEFYHFDGASWRQIVNTVNNLWKSSTTRNYVYNNTDSIGIGATTPDEKLHVLNGKIYVQDNRSGQDPHVIFDIPDVDGNEGGLQFKRTGDTLASINYVEDASIANFIRLGVGNAGKGNDFTLNSNGEVGIGTKNPLGQLHINAYSGDNIVIRDADGIIQFTKPAAFVGDVDRKKGFIQISNNDDLRLGTNSGNDFGNIIFRTNATDQVAIDPDGEVGIGTITPLTKLHIPTGEDADLASNKNGYIMLGAGSTTSLLLDNNEIMVRTNYTTPGILAIQNDGGEVTVGARTTINKGGEALALDGNNPGMSFYQNGAFRSFINQSANELYIGVNAGNLHLDATGQIAIGAVVPAASAYKLTVSGKIICEEVKVKLVSSGWPDYVFDNKYKLPSLPEVEKFIQKNKHLPNMPCASEVEKNGIEVGDMQKRMMEKIEELTLYIIELQKQVDELKKISK